MGRLSGYAGRRVDAIRYLEAFVKRTQSGRVALNISLEGELEEAKKALGETKGN